ncbi:MAG: hypothetical protein QXT26_06785 [Thermoproteota archaeon]
MKEVLERLSTSVHHLKIIHEFFLSHDSEYALIEKKINSIPNIDKLYRHIYYGQDGRQMILSDIFQHALVTRGYYFFFENREAYIKLLFYAANQLMLQENIIRNQPERKKLLDYLENISNQIPGFFEGKDPEWRSKYEKCKTASREDVIGARKTLYRVIDSVLPKSMGNATELLVFAYLLSSKIGYVIPLLEIQQAQTLNDETGVTPPDFLIIKDRKIFGCEVGAGPGGVGKISQCNIFMEKTGIPVITVRVNPPGNNASYRCPICDKWILYCDRIIDEYSKRRIRDVNLQGIKCQSCQNYNECDKIMYFGRLKRGGEKLHYHYNCVRDLEYVKKAVNLDVFHQSISLLKDWKDWRNNQKTTLLQKECFFLAF